ncbi:hypothetical protein ANN_25137 [Periplaneta americana]|uniref:C2H2-type domain-containing protein n=1 Tax=Periplaneta americana TaxID=6978 RepID=A0ABQ8S0S0_PERAM|nr:hypothetical protein ANN_25137 [Periplaneta americana]
MLTSLCLLFTDRTELWDNRHNVTNNNSASHVDKPIEIINDLVWFQREHHLTSVTSSNQQTYSGMEETGTIWPPSRSGVQFPCPKCGKKYYYKHNLGRHIRQECGKEPQFHCPYCPHLTKHKANIVTLDSLPQTMNFLAPELLPSDYHQPYDTVTHHVGLELEMFPCPQCGKGYRHKQNLMRHIKYECGKEPQFCCPICSNRYRQKNGVTIFGQEGYSIKEERELFGSYGAPRVEHNSPNWFISDQLNNTMLSTTKLFFFTDGSSYESQSHFYNSNERFYKITDTTNWSETITSQQQLKMESHPCQKCGKVYSRKGNLQRHLSWECGKEPCRKCPYCPFITNYKGTVQKHIRRRHINMPNIM